MRTIPLLFSFSLAFVPVRAAFAQVTDAERAAARDLFKQGDQLQRAGHFTEALDKFQRAQQVFSAPTNLLRIAECDAALGRLVESAEAYREVLRTTLPAGAPPAFQAAVDQAKAELSQVEPRVPKLVVQMQPPGVQGAQMQIDGQNVPGALIGEPMSLDAGVHRIVVLAPGYSSAEQQVDLKERDNRTALFSLSPAAGALAAPPASGNAPAGGGAMPPPPPPIVGAEPAALEGSNMSVLFGLHLGVEAAGSSVPTANSSDGFVNPGVVSSSGLALGLDGGLRFARHWYVGLTVEHAALGGGSAADLMVAKATSNTSLTALLLGFIANPDRLSFWGEVGLGTRWFTVDETKLDEKTIEHQSYISPQFTLGGGLWIPAGRSFRIVPKIVLGVGSFQEHNASDSTSSQGQVSTFGMLGVAGFYNLDL